MCRLWVSPFILPWVCVLSFVLIRPKSFLLKFSCAEGPFLHSLKTQLIPIILSGGWIFISLLPQNLEVFSLLFWVLWYFLTMMIGKPSVFQKTWFTSSITRGLGVPFSFSETWKFPSQFYPVMGVQFYLPQQLGLPLWVLPKGKFTFLSFF